MRLIRQQAKKYLTGHWFDGEYEIEGIENYMTQRTFLWLKLKPKTTSYLVFISIDGLRRHRLKIPVVTLGGSSIVKDGFYSNYMIKQFGK